MPGICGLMESISARRKTRDCWQIWRTRLNIVSGGGDGALVLSTVTLLTDSDCQAANKSSCTNTGHYVFTSLFVFGNPAQDTAHTRLGDPPANYLSGAKTIAIADYLTDSGLRADRLSDLLTFIPNQSGTGGLYFRANAAPATEPAKTPPEGPDRMRDRSSEKGASLIIFALLLSMVMLPMLGLCIDVSFIYFAKARLYSAVDAAALAGGRSLSVGLDFASQKANAENVAGQYFRANYPNAFLGSQNIVVNAEAKETGDLYRTVSVNATADVSAVLHEDGGHFHRRD